MGSATLELTTLDLSRPTDIILPLQDNSKPASQLGEILLTATLLPKTQEDKDQVCTPLKKIAVILINM